MSKTLHEGKTEAEAPDATGYRYTITVDGESALEDLHNYVAFCYGRKTATFLNYGVAVSAAQGLRNALSEAAVVAIVVGADF